MTSEHGREQPTSGSADLRPPAQEPGRAHPTNKVTLYGLEGATVVLVGEAPSRKMQLESKQHYALMRPDLAELAGVRFPGEYFKLFRRCNLLNNWPGPSVHGKGDAWKPETAHERAKGLTAYLHVFSQGRTDKPLHVVLLGRRVAHAFRFHPMRPWFEGVQLHDSGPLYHVAPHPSKINRWWHKPENVVLAREFWQAQAAYARGA